MKKHLLLSMLAALTAMAQDGVPLPQAGNVSLPLDEYNRLKELAANPPKKSQALPAEWVIQSADCKLRVAGQAVTGTIQLDGAVLQKGPVQTWLVSGMTVLDARLSGKALPLLQRNGMRMAVLDGPADFSVALDVGLPVEVDPGRAHFTLPAPAAGTVRLNLTLPGEQTNATLSQGLITGRSSSGGQTVIDATLVPGQAATVSWSVRGAAEPPAAPKELRFFSDVKTLVTVNDGEITLASLIDITVIQGAAEKFEVKAPAGYEVTGADGPTLQEANAREGGVTLQVNRGARSHQFLVSMTKEDTGTKEDTIARFDLAMPEMEGAQKETGEALVEGVGTLELTATASGGLRRADVKEASAPLRSLASHPVYAAFRYQRKPAETPAMTLQFTRFADAAELAAVAQRAEVTTLVTSEGRSLTEVKLTVKNQSQPFVKVELPPGATIVSAEVEGKKVKPVEGADGHRVPLLRTGFRPNGAYTVSFVFLHSGAPFTKKGVGELTLPKMDIAVGVVQWEVFLPKQYRVAGFGGDAIPAGLMPAAADLAEFAELRPDVPGAVLRTNFTPPMMVGAIAGQLSGRVTDPSGAVVRGARILAKSLSNGMALATGADANGNWVLSGMPAGPTTVDVGAPGFQTQERSVYVSSSGGATLNATLAVGDTSDDSGADLNSSAKEVYRSVSNGMAGPGGFGVGGGGGRGGAVATGSGGGIGRGLSSIATETGGKTSLDTPNPSGAQAQSSARQNAAGEGNTSQNVIDLQRRVAGVLPISVSVPRAGNSYRFVRPLVIDEETRVTFNYRMGK